MYKGSGIEPITFWSTDTKCANVDILMFFVSINDGKLLKKVKHFYQNVVFQLSYQSLFILKINIRDGEIFLVVNVISL